MIAKNLRCSRATPTESTYCSFAGDFSAHRAVKTVGAPILVRDAKRTWRRRRFYCATRRELGEGADFTTRREENLAKAPILVRDAKRTWRRRRFYCATRRESAKAPILLRDAKRTRRRRRFYCATRRESAKAPISLRDAKRNRRRREVHCTTRREIGDAYDFFLHCDHLSKKFFIRFLFSSDLHTMGPIKGPKRKEENP